MQQSTSLFPLIFESRTKTIRVFIQFSIRQFYLVGVKDPGGINLLRPIIKLVNCLLSVWPALGPGNLGILSIWT